MKNKKLFLPAIIFCITVIAMIVFAVINGITQKPVITEQEFPFSITYEIDEKTETIEGIYACSFEKIGGYASLKERIYNGRILGNEDSENVSSYILRQDEKGMLILETTFYADYLMGDAESDYYTEEYPYQPLLLYFDNEGMDSAEGLEIEQYNAKIINWEYPKPIENSFVFSHISGLSGASAVPLTGIAFLAVLASILFVKKESDVVYTRLDKVFKVCGFLISLLLVPFSTYVVFLSDILGVSTSLLGQIIYCVPAMMTLGVAAFICLSKKGYSKSARAALLISLPLFGILFLL